MSNNFGKIIENSLEPEGTIFELQVKKFITELSSNENPIIDFKINKENGKLCFSVWPENGSYEVIPIIKFFLK